MLDSPPLKGPQRTQHLPFVVLLGGPALLLSVTLTAGYFYSVRSSTQNVTMGDRALVITVPEVIELTHLADTGYEPKAEVLRKVKLPRGGRELEYRYAGPKPPWAIRAQVVAELDEAQAKATYAQWAQQALERGDLPNEPVAGWWGDESRVGVLRRNGAMVGHFFVGRKGARVVLYRLEGVVLSAPLTFEALIAPHLAHAEQFAP